MTTRPAILAVIALSLAACGDKPEAPPEPIVRSAIEVLPNIPMPPGGQALSSQGGEEAASLLISTPMPADSVVEYYRGVLSRPPYQLVNESVNGKTTSFYVDQSGRPMWVNVEPLEAGGTLVRMTGAVQPVDSTTAVPSAPAATTN